MGGSPAHCTKSEKLELTSPSEILAPPSPPKGGAQGGWVYRPCCHVAAVRGAWVALALGHQGSTPLLLVHTPPHLVPVQLK